VLDEAEFARWRSSAERTLDAGAQLAATGSFEWACFLAEAAAQLGVKGVLHGLGEPG
jgi:HEPN domain-containing protein